MRRSSSSRRPELTSALDDDRPWRQPRWRAQPATPKPPCVRAHRARRARAQRVRGRAVVQRRVGRRDAAALPKQQREGSRAARWRSAPSGGSSVRQDWTWCRAWLGKSSLPQDRVGGSRGRRRPAHRVRCTAVCRARSTSRRSPPSAPASTGRIGARCAGSLRRRNPSLCTGPCKAAACRGSAQVRRAAFAEGRGMS